ncbi:acetyl-coenzyme-A carboxylase [Coemansia sp. RSA 2673]|nr:acetyl-coenzyme-A carboxylase [Coemansia sp. RSA 2673]
MMEMYADEKSRGGVLEPEGIVEIKFRKPQMLACMERLDPQVRELRQSLGNPDLSPEQKSDVKKALDAREKALLPVYTQLAIQFADLHDRAGRMAAKGVIRKELQWAGARTYFFYRVKRRLAEEKIRRDMRAISPNVSRADQTAIIRTWFEKSQPSSDFDLGDVTVAAWFEDCEKDIAACLDAWKTQVVAERIAAQLSEASDESLLAALQNLSTERRKQILAKLL